MNECASNCGGNCVGDNVRDCSGDCVGDCVGNNVGDGVGCCVGDAHLVASVHGGTRALKVLIGAAKSSSRCDEVIRRVVCAGGASAHENLIKATWSG